MKKLLSVLFLLASFIAKGQIAVVTTATVTCGASSGTTPSFNSTGGSCIIVTLDYHTSTAPGLCTDSKTCTWHQIIDKQANPSASAGARAYYCDPCNFGTSHTVTTAGHFALLTVTVLSGTAAGNPIDQSNGSSTATGSGTTFQPGSITPSVSGTYCFTSACNFAGTAPGNPTGYTLIGNCITSTAEAGIGSYKSLSGTSAENPTITGMTNGNPWAGIIFNVKAPSTPSPSTNGGVLMMLLGN